VVAAGGASLSDVIKVKVILTRAEDFAAFNAAYREIFPTDPPARVSMVAGLTIDARVEIDGVAGGPEGKPYPPVTLIWRLTAGLLRRRSMTKSWPRGLREMASRIAASSSSSLSDDLSGALRSAASS